MLDVLTFFLLNLKAKGSLILTKMYTNLNIHNPLTYIKLHEYLCVEKQDMNHWYRERDDNL